MELLSLGYAIVFSVIGFIVIYAKKQSGKFEYVFESFEYILLISGPLIVGASFVVNQEIKNYFLIAYIIAILGWFIFWVFVKKWDTKEENEKEKTALVKPFVIGMFIGFLAIGFLLLAK